MNAGTVELVVAAANALGEGPSWDRSAQALMWVDILGQNVHRYSIDTSEHLVWDVGQPVTAIVPRDAGGFALTLEDSIAVTETWGDLPRTLVRIDHGPHPCRMNDAKCDSRGRLWAGSMALDAKPGSGALYRYDPDGSIHRMLGDVTISNGLGWSPDDTRMYYVDTGRQAVDVFEFDVATGSIGNRRQLAAIPPAAGAPDGLAVDSEGNIWVALFGGSALHQYDPAGALKDVVEVPATQVTSCVFGGPDLLDLYVTSAAVGLPTAEGSAARFEGGLFKLRMSLPGSTTFSFGG
jgi:sugar lactone lactonase YvrE